MGSVKVSHRRICFDVICNKVLYLSCLQGCGKWNMYYSRVIYVYIILWYLRVFVCRCMHCNMYTPPLIYNQHEDELFRAEACC